MKKLLLVSLLILPLTLFAKIWIVDSNPGSASKDFVNLQEAHDGASAGDTLYLIGSSVSYITSKVTISKRIVIIGPGYFLNNPETLVSLLPAVLRLTTTFCTEAGIDFVAGSEGSVAMGLTFNCLVRANTSNIMIKRNHFIGLGFCPTYLFAASGSNVSVVQNYFQTNSNIGGILIPTGFSNVTLRNNYIQGLSFSAGSVPAIRTEGSGVEISNNVIAMDVFTSNALVQNNVCIGGGFTSTTSVVRNNMHVNNSVFPAGNGNVNGVAFASIFVATGTTDGQWKLKDGSPALGSGYNGTDMGMFGGAEPYVLSGIPPIPTIYSLDAPLTGEKNTGLPIEIKAKSNN
ncbi:MAG: hypothetical protein KF725_10850 [Cyclobacteriaceae bacterium]|nr:hypothetical protein [Cyclobacteriaceae bacterium]UYN86204.1 MAG: hypothetical protein KIT51_15240 [Cyclobacteriaceae bacterium]